MHIHLEEEGFSQRKKPFILNMVIGMLKYIGHVTLQKALGSPDTHLEFLESKMDLANGMLQTSNNINNYACNFYEIPRAILENVNMVVNGKINMKCPQADRQMEYFYLRFACRSRHVCAFPCVYVYDLETIIIYVRAPYV